MSLRDRFGRLLSRLRATRPSVVERQRAAADARLAKFSGQARAVSEQGKRERRLRQLGIESAGFDARDQQSKQNRLAELGITAAPEVTRDIDPEDLTTDWIPVSSSNVDAIRWVGGHWGLQVRFKKKGWEYAYHVPYSTFDEMLSASSKGKFVWYMRNAGIPYHRLTAGISPTRLAYPFGRTVGGHDNRELIRNPNFPRRKLGGIK